MLYLVNDMDIIDKHKLMLPSVAYSTVPRSRWLKEIPDWPSHAKFRSITFANFAGSLKWNSGVLPKSQLGSPVFGKQHLFRRVVEIPTEITTQVRGEPRPMIATLTEMLDGIRQTLTLMRCSVVKY
jgi:hypothetical protein